MARDHGLEEILREDLEVLSGLSEKLCLVVWLGFLIESLSLRLVMMGCWPGLASVETVGHSNNQTLFQ